MKPLNDRRRTLFSLGAALMVLFLFPAVAAAYVNLQYPSSAGVGKPFAIRLTSPEVLQEVSVEWQGRTVPLEISQWNGKYIALGLFGSSVAKTKPGVHTMNLRLKTPGGTTERSVSIRLRSIKYKEDHLTLPEKMVTPPGEVLAKIALDREATSKALATQTLSRKWGLPLQRPVNGIVTSPYGRRRILNGKPRNPHGGIDYRAAVGTPVAAALPGRVLLTGDHYYAGKSVYVDSGGGVISHYFHLNSISVKEGDPIATGQKIGESGMTGRATGPHLHFGLSLSGQMVDPEPLYSLTIAELLDQGVFLRIETKRGE